MSIQSKKNERQARRAYRVRAKLRATGAGVRVSVFRSLNHFYAQLIDDNQGKTLVACSTLELKKVSGDKKEQAKAVGLELAKRAQQQGITVAALDRGSFLYHGRVKSFADGLREGGMNI